MIASCTTATVATPRVALVALWIVTLIGVSDAFLPTATMRSAGATPRGSSSYGGRSAVVMSAEGGTTRGTLGTVCCGHVCYAGSHREKLGVDGSAIIVGSSLGQVIKMNMTQVRFERKICS